MMKKFERFVVDGAFIERCNGNTPYAEIIYRLHYLENIMEKYKCFTPQDLGQRIAELEEENKTLLQQNKFLCDKNGKLFDEIHNAENIIGFQHEEIAVLVKQLKNAIVPKYRVGQKVWFIADPDEAKYREVENLKIEEISISSLFPERGIMYAGGDWAGISENELFATEAEAKKYLEMKND